MEYERTRDIIEHARAFHGRLEELYQGLAEKAEKQRVKMLLDHLSRHERRLREVLSRYEQHAAREMLDTWFQYVPEEETLQRFAAVDWTDDMSIDQIIENALRLDQYLLDLFRESANRALGDDIRDVLGSLLTLEEEEMVRLKRSALYAELL